MSEFVLNPARHGPFPGRLAPETVAAYAAATVAMPEPVTSSGLYGWLCIGWVNVNRI